MTVVGNGDIAQTIRGFVQHQDWTYFASGVSNSQETREEEYAREFNLLMEQPKDRRLVYFSTLAIFRADVMDEWTRYTSHKRRMEETIQQEFDKWIIVRLGNITWGDNPHTLINFLRKQCQDGVEPTLIPTDRYIVEKADFLYWIVFLPDFNCEVNIPGRIMKVADVWEKYVVRASWI